MIGNGSATDSYVECSKKNAREMLNPQGENERKYPSPSDHYIKKIRDVSSCVCR